VDKEAKKPIIGILGGIGSGKSTVAAHFAKLGCKVIDADEIAHKLLETPAVKKQIISLLGKNVLDPAGRINHKKIADIVFNDAQKLLSLNSIIHPLVLAHAEQLITQYNQQENVKAIVLDMPLLVEVGWHNRCDKLIFVDCSLDLRVDRAQKTGFFDKNQLKIRENFQISLDKKASIADNTISNSSSFEALVKQVADIFSGI
jgi:dephospho-CoA kinase